MNDSMLANLSLDELLARDDLMISTRRVRSMLEERDRRDLEEARNDGYAEAEADLSGLPAEVVSMLERCVEDGKKSIKRIRQAMEADILNKPYVGVQLAELTEILEATKKIAEG